MSDASGPNPSGCRDIDESELRALSEYVGGGYFRGAAKVQGKPSPIRHAPEVRRDLIALLDRERAECARLTAQLAAVTAERDEYAAMLDDSLAKWEALIATAGAICGHCKQPCANDAMSEHMRTCEKSPMVAEIARLTSALHGATTSTDCTCTHSGARHREEEGTGAARECLVDGCECRQFGNVHMALAAATARAGEAALVAIVELDTIACGPHAPCEGPVERAIVALLRLVPMGADEELSAKERLAALRTGGGR